MVGVQSNKRCKEKMCGRVNKVIKKVKTVLASKSTLNTSQKIEIFLKIKSLKNLTKKGLTIVITITVGPVNYCTVNA